MPTTLTADHVQKKYNSHLALQDASLQLHQGEILALLGPNGAGKTTLIKILATLLTKNAGKVEILGYDLDRHAETIRHLIGYVGQDTERSAYARLTVWENLQFFDALRGMDKSQVRAQSSRLVDYFDFHGQMERLFGSLSGGQKQTVVILRALLHDPPLIYLDEPTKGLDPLIGRRIRSFLKRYVHEQGKSLLLTSHVLSEVDELADQVALIQGGRIHVSGTSESLKEALGAREFVELEKRCLPVAVLARLLALPVVRCQMEGEPGWVSLGVSDAMAGAEAIIRVLRSEHVQASFHHHSAPWKTPFYTTSGLCKNASTPDSRRNHMLPSLSIEKPTLSAQSLSRPVSPLAIALATLRKNLQITVRYLPNLLGSLVEISVRALFFLLFSNVISVNSYEMSGIAMTGHNLYIFLLGSLVLFVFTRRTLWGPINAVTNDLYNGTLEYLYSSPGSRHAYYMGVVLSEVVVSLVVFIPLFILLVIISGVDLSSLLLMLLASATVLVSLTAMGIMIALLALLWRQVSSIASVLGILFEMLAGAYLPLSAFPACVRVFSYLLPFTWGYDLLRYYSFSAQGAAWQTILPVWQEWGVVVVFAVGFTAVSRFLLGRAEKLAKRQGLSVL